MPDELPEVPALPPCVPAPIDDQYLPKIEDSVNTATITDGCVDGTGIYDVFMQAHMDAIHQEYAKQRIKGSEYSKVYLGGMQQAMQSAVAFALGKGKAAAETELARYAILKASAELCLIEAQIAEMNNKVKLTEIQCWTELSKIHSDPVDVAAAPDLATLRLWGLDRIDGTIPINAITGVFQTQMDKTNAEKDLLKQKKTTEHAQTNNGDGVTPDHIYTGQALKQRNLLQRQADGFVRDAEATAAKIRIDAHNIEFSTMDGEGDNVHFYSDNTSLIKAETNVDKVESPNEDLPVTIPTT